MLVGSFRGRIRRRFHGVEVSEWDGFNVNPSSSFLGF